VSRAYNAKRKAKRQKARRVATPAPRRHAMSLGRLGVILPVLAIAAVLAATAVLGFGADEGKSREEVVREVTALLAGVPQNGTTLGSPDAPITLLVFVDLECPTVRRFVVRYLPSIINDWVRPGTVKLAYRSLRTDTYIEEMFFRQEAAALAAGRQDKLWNFAMTFAHEQGPRATGYASNEFLTDIATQVPNMKLRQWHEERKEPLLSRQVARSLYSARNQDLRETPSFLIRFAKGADGNAGSRALESTRKEFLASFKKAFEALRKEAVKDKPQFGVLG
jgi:Thioredoxin